MHRLEYFLEGFRFIGSEEYKELKSRRTSLKGEELRDFRLYNMRQVAHDLTWCDTLPTLYDVSCLGAILVVLAEVERRINVILNRPQKEITEHIVDGRIEEVCILDEATNFKMGKLIRPTKLDVRAQQLYKWLNTPNKFKENTIISSNTDMFNISATPEKLGALLIYRTELERRVKTIRESEEYKWFQNKDGYIVGTWDKKNF